ncbi:MAG: hypothetical protein H0T51_06870 [Pirellulales bacterium]|nr:hypothetical protein [Pirellulales bacterium]
MPIIRSTGEKAIGVLRRGSRFGMRTLLLATSVVCIAMGAWTIYVQPFRAQAASRARVGDLGGKTSAVTATGPDWHRWLVETMVGSDQFIHVDRADLRGCRVSAADVPPIAGLRYLKTLYLDRAEVTDENIAALARMSELEELSLTYTSISDEGLARIAALPSLRTLHLTGIPITDASLGSLAHAPWLREIYIRWTKVTPDGVERLRRALPNCQIHHHVIQAPAAAATASSGEPSP